MQELIFKIKKLGVFPWEVGILIEVMGQVKRQLKGRELLQSKGGRSRWDLPFFVNKNNLWNNYGHRREAVRKCERLGNEQNDKRMSFLVHPSRSRVSFTGSELFYNSVRCRKLIIMHVIIVHKNVNTLYLVPYNWLLSCGYSPVLYLFVNSLQDSWLHVFSEFLGHILSSYWFPYWFMR